MLSFSEINRVIQDYSWLRCYFSYFRSGLSMQRSARRRRNQRRRRRQGQIDKFQFLFLFLFPFPFPFYTLISVSVSILIFDDLCFYNLISSFLFFLQFSYIHVWPSNDYFMFWQEWRSRRLASRHRRWARCCEEGIDHSRVYAAKKAGSEFFL